MLPAVAEQLGLASRCLGVGSEIAGERSEPTGSDLHIAVEQHHIVGLHLRQGAVVAFGKAVVGIEADQADLGKFAAEQVNGVIRRGIVGHDDACIVRIANNRGQELTEHTAPVPIEYDDCGGHDFVIKNQ